MKVQTGVFYSYFNDMVLVQVRAAEGQDQVKLGKTEHIKNNAAVAFTVIGKTS